MSAAASASTASDPGCEPGPVAHCSSVVATKVVAASPRRGRPYASLRSRSDIGRVRRNGVRRRVGGITVFAASGPSAGPRVAFVAGRRVGTAVQRNRAKRRLREAFAALSFRVDRDYVVIAGSAVTGAPFEDLVAWLTRAVSEED